MGLIGSTCTALPSAFSTRNRSLGRTLVPSLFAHNVPVHPYDVHTRHLHVPGLTIVPGGSSTVQQLRVITSRRLERLNLSVLGVLRIGDCMLGIRCVVQGHLAKGRKDSSEGTTAGECAAKEHMSGAKGLE